MSFAEDNGYDAYDVSDYIGFVSVKMKPKEARQSQEWVTRDGRSILVVDMENSHLFNAYMTTGAECLFNEMVYRLFEKTFKGEK